MKGSRPRSPRPAQRGEGWGEGPLPHCRLCQSQACVPAGKSVRRDLVHCPACDLVFVPEAQWLSVKDERTRYAHHENSASNEGYVRFLGEVADVVGGLVEANAHVLDFGSGEQAVLTRLLRARGRNCIAYDPLYDLGTDALGEHYDVIVLCEVIEHLRDLRTELLRLARCLRPGGRLVVRTQCYPSIAELPGWWYARDPTHINFFSPNALQVAARLCELNARPSATPDISVWSPAK